MNTKKLVEKLRIKAKSLENNPTLHIVGWSLLAVADSIEECNKTEPNNTVRKALEAAHASLSHIHNNVGGEESVLELIEKALAIIDPPSSV